MIHRFTIKKLFFSTVLLFFLSVFTSYSSNLHAQSEVFADRIDASAFFIENTDILAAKESIDIPLVAKIPRASKVTGAIAGAGVGVGKPVRLTIPSLNIDANIEHIGLTAEGAVGAPEGPYDTSWYSLGARPGEKGNALISGHSGIWQNTIHSIFDYLPTIKDGAKIYVKDDRGVKRAFVVTGRKIYGKDETVPELFASSDQAHVNIITCYGAWLASVKTYDKRLVVFTELVSAD